MKWTAHVPVPTNPRVAVPDVDAHHVAAIRFSENFNDSAAEAKRVELEVWRPSEGLVHAGDWRVASYDAPRALPMLRRNDVMVMLGDSGGSAYKQPIVNRLP